MSNYSKTTNFTAKDSLPTGNANKKINGSLFDTEFDNIVTHIATKSNIASPTFTGIVTAPDITLNAANPEILGGDTDGVLIVAAGTTNILGSVLKLYGDTHATKAGDYEHLDDAGVVYHYDASGALHNITGAVTVSGLITGATVTSTGLLTATAGITSGSNIVSDADSTDSLGSTGVRWLKGWFDTLQAGTLVAGAGSITDTSGAITFGDENLVTTGTLGSAAFTSSGLVTGGSLVLATGATLTGFADEDNMASNSATLGSTQQSIKAYVDAQQDTVDTWAEVLALGNSSGGTNVVVTAGQVLTTNTISETSAASGVTIDSVLLKDNGVTATNLTGTLQTAAQANITSVGTLTSLTTGGAILSDTDSTDSLGSTGVRWLKGWFDTLTAGTLTIGSGSVTDSSGAITFGNENLTTTGTLGAGVATLASSSTVGNLTFANGSITDSSGAITFGNENLVTTGTLGSGALTVATNATLTAGDLSLAAGEATITSTIGGSVTLQRNDTSVGAGNILGEIIFQGNDTSGNAMTDLGRIYVDAGGAQSAGDNPTRMFFQTTLDGTSVLSTALTLNNGGGTHDATFAGNLDIVAALSKGSGTFRIDHPLPELNETHHLVHSFVEAPLASNLYAGMVGLIDGEAHINIDEVSGMTEGTFELLNHLSTWSSSNESSHSSVICSVLGNILTIECEDITSTDTVYWEVRGERKDKHILETYWTDDEGHAIVEPEKTTPKAILIRKYGKGSPEYIEGMTLSELKDEPGYKATEADKASLAELLGKL